nr:hypothetical protein Hi04_10k_c5016_00043 [uncultured bacterium]
MDRVSRFGVPLFLIVALAAPLCSAHDMMAPEEETIEILLLRQKSVRDELKLNEAVSEKIKTYSANQWKKAQDASKLSKSEQDAKFDEMGKENRQFLETNLTKAQQERLEQITLQVAGLSCITRPKIAERLQLTADQKSKAKQLQKEASEDLEQLVKSNDSNDRKQEINKLWDKNDHRINQLLTDSQKATWKQMTGHEFKGEFVYASK